MSYLYEEVYDIHTDTAGNWHWIGTGTGHHVLRLKNDEVNGRKGRGMKWKDFVEMTTNTVYRNARLTDIECPKCGEKIYCRTDIVLASYPPKRSYYCECGWTGIA